VQLSLWYYFSRTSKFVIGGPNPKICIYTDDICNQEVFQISFPRFVREAKYGKVETAGGKRMWYWILGLQKTYCTSCNSVFPVWHLYPRFTYSLYLLVEDLRCSQCWGFIMQTGLGHCVVWYMVMNILEEHSGLVFRGSGKMEAVCPDWDVGTCQTTQSCNSENCNFWIWIFCIVCALYCYIAIAKYTY
jgi:hypothetical protein